MGFKDPPLSLKNLILWLCVGGLVMLTNAFLVQGCFHHAVGVADPNIIPDNQMNASTYYDESYVPEYGRLDDIRGYGWSSSEPDVLDDWLQVDFGEIVEVCSVATQGEVNNFEWVIDFHLSFSSDGATWTNYTDGNGVQVVFTRLGDGITTDNHTLPVTVSAKYIRFHPITQESWNNLRVEVYKEIDECDTGSHNCDPLASCANSVGSFDCTCGQGYSGDGITCSDIDECTTNEDNCDPHASCANSIGSFDCTCSQGYSGDGITCSDFDECAANTDNCDPRSASCANSIGSFNCTCNQGYSGDGLTCSDIDECTTNEDICDPHASCANSVGSFVCTCNQGYSGDGITCSDLDECAVNTDNCDRSASCANSIGSFNCTCNQGYSGDGITCSDIDECTTNEDNCDPHASCANSVGSFDCTCNQGYSGDGLTCSDIDECTTNEDNCDPHASCANSVGSFNCTCNQGYSGDGLTCSDIDECTTNEDNCDPHASCANSIGSFICTCNQGYSGDGINCSDFDECAANTDNCDLSASCNNSVGSFDCTCNQGYSGDGLTCSDIDECTTNEDNCDPHASCANSVGSFNCTCNQGYSGDGITCSDLDECAANTDNCDRSASCANSIGSFNCTCNQGYSGDGITCSDIDECTTNEDNCDPHASCANSVGSFDCTCNQGYSGDGLTCSDIDECTTNEDNCDPHASCANSVGSFNCTCNQGYSGDGLTCSDIDECTTNEDNCDPHASCANSIGSFICTCNQGYSGDGINCSDFDECAANTDNCDLSASCNNSVGSFDCTCNQGYSGDGLTCSDIDECTTNEDNCDPHASCANSVGSFNCTCNQGYSVDGLTCSDIDECTTNEDNCDPHASCANSIGSFNCTCNQGYSGDGIACPDFDECAANTDNCDISASCNNSVGSFDCTCNQGYSGDGLTCSDIDECTTNEDNCDPHASCANSIGSFNCTCNQGYSGDGINCSDIDECATATHNCHGVAHCYNNEGSFTCSCRDGYTGDGLVCEPIGEFIVTILNISKDTYNPTPVKRSVKYILQAKIQGLPEDATVTESVLHWYLVNEAELAASVSAEGTLVSQGTAEWVINRRSVPAGIYQVKFTALYTISDPVAPRILQAFDYGFIRSVAGPVLAIIDGGSSVRWGSTETVIVDGSLSYDGDIGPGTHTGLQFTWSCHDPLDNLSMSYDCFGAFANENDNSTAISIDTTKLDIGKTYVLRLSLIKDERSAFAEMSFEIAAGEVPQVTLRCLIDCGAVVSASNKLRVTSECPNLACNGSVYEWNLKQLNDATNTWENITILPNMTSTAVNATNMIIKKNALPSGFKFRLMLVVTSPAGSEGFGVLEFKTAGAPHSGYCRTSVNEGVALETEFTFECFEWQAETTAITYEFRAGKDPISYGSSPKSASTVLPAGQSADDYQLQIIVIIKNSVGVAVVATLYIKVKGSSKLDPCLTPAEEVGNQLKSIVIGKDNKLDALIGKGEISPAAQLAISVLKAANADSDCGQELSITVIILISKTIAEKFTVITPESIEMSRVIMAVIIEATGGGGGRGRGGGGDEAAVLEMALKMTETATKVLVNALSDPEEPLTAEVEEAAVGVAGCLKNVMKSSSGASQATGSTAGDSSASKNSVEKASQNLNNMSDAFLGRLVRSEAMVIKTDGLAVALKKVSSDDVKGLGMEEGPSKIKMPGNLGNIGGGDINAKMTAFNFNPLSWDNSSKAVQSSVVGLELQNGKTKINVSNLDEDIVMVIPISSPPKNNTNTSDVPEHSFLKPNTMATRVYNAELADIPVTIMMGIAEKGVFRVKVFVKLGSKPTIENFDHNFTNTFKSMCDNQTDDEQNQTSCLPEKSSMTVVPTKAGLLYVGIVLWTTNTTQHSRERRSCFGHGRQRRSCVGVKDPPPKGVTKTVVPKYDPSTDVNYTMTITQSSCLYWSEDKQKWTSDGCKVDSTSNSTHLVCRCNHLTSFGGNFIQAPNPIDFDKVFAAFGNLSESGNISVLVTIACAFLLYFIVIVFARRADKRDENKMCPPKHVTIVEEGTYYYDMAICTGVWKNSATTANVTISIKGEINEHSQVPLQSKGESSEMFARGSINGFVLITNESLGPLKEITLEHDNAGENPSWFVETVTIRDRQTEEQWLFPINQWLAVEKGDGLIEATVKIGSSGSFSDQFRSRFGRKIADSHLWMSVFGKACSSTFTRVQRASCCLSVLFSAMIANAMFYNIGGESEDAIQVGPFKFSLKQIVVGVQSGLIIAPVNIIIVLLFKSSKPKRKRGDKYQEIDHAQQLVDQASDAGCMLPHFCVYFAWFLCLVTTLAAATFTLFYSMMWGKEVAEQWLSSILISNGQDIFVVQPTKVMLAVVVVSLLVTRTKDDKDPAGENEDDNVYMNDIDLLSDDPKERFKRSRLEVMRERAKKSAKLAGMMKEIVLHLTFVFFLAIVCYGNKNSFRFMMNTTLVNPFPKFDTVTGRYKLWGWLRQEFLPNFYSQPWYNGAKDKEDVYVENKMSILIGMPWMRQLRIKKNSCTVLPSFISDCYYDYSSEDEDTTPISLPGWKLLPFNTSWPKALQLCPKPWRYQTGEELHNDPIKGTYNTYEGGGYVAVMGYDVTTAQGVLGETFGYGWVDRQTRAVILEFAVFSVNTNLLSIATYFFEVLASGAAHTAKRVDTLELYSTESGSLMFYLICQFLFMAMVLFNFIMMLVNLYRQRLGFFKSVWNMVDFLMIISSVASVAFYMIRSKSVLKSIKAIQNNPYDIVHFHTALDWASWENAAVAFAIFMVTVKLLNLIRFNPYVIYLFSSFRQSVGYQLSYVLFFLIMFNAFVTSGKQFFGHTVLEYSSYMQAVISQFEFLLGKAVPLDEMRSEHPFLGPSFAFLYMITMTVVLMNMLVSVLNESYIDAKTHAEESAGELEMARFIGERFVAMFQPGKIKRPEFKLYCDEATFANMCLFEAEPFCSNSEGIAQCTYERVKKVEQRLSALSRRTENIEIDDRREEDEFVDLLHSLVNPKSHQGN